MIKEVYKSIKASNYINIDIKFRKNKNIINYITNPSIENSDILLLDVYKYILYQEHDFEKEVFKHDIHNVFEDNIYKNMSKTERDIHYHNMMLNRCKKLKKSDFNGTLCSYIYLLYLCQNVLKHCKDINIETELINILEEVKIECETMVNPNIRTSLISNRNIIFELPLQNCIKGVDNETIKDMYNNLVTSFLNLIKYVDYSKGAY